MPAGEALETEGEVKGVDSLDLECSCILFIRVLPRLAGRTDSSAAALFRAALISAALSWKIYIGERRETSIRSRCLFVVGLSIERRASFFFLFFVFCSVLHSQKMPEKEKSEVMASSPGEEAAGARATPAASPSRALSALRGFRDRLVDECRVEVRRRNENGK
jgi:hypothetical protein